MFLIEIDIWACQKQPLRRLDEYIHIVSGTLVFTQTKNATVSCRFDMGHPYSYSKFYIIPQGCNPPGVCR